MPEYKMKSNDDKMKFVNIRTGEEETKDLKNKIKRYTDDGKTVTER